MGIVRDLYIARKIGAGLKLPAPTVGSLIKRLLLAKILYSEAKKTETGVLIHILDALAEPAIAAVVNIAPVQNLNGYTRPWPAGGGKNKLDNILTTSTRNTVTFTTQNDGSVIAVSTTPPEATSYADLVSSGFSLPEGTYVLSGCPSGGGNNSYDLRIKLTTNGTSQTLYDYGSGVEFTIQSGTVIDNIRTAIRANYDASAGVTFWPMIRLASVADDSYEPYSNICPISGITGLSVYVSPTNDVDDATAYAVDWTSPAGTVYGGKIDVVTGVLTVDRAYVDMGSLTWTQNATNFMNFYSTGLQNVVKRPPNTATGYLYVVCSTYASVPVQSSGDCYIYVNTSGQIRVKDTANASLTGPQFKTLMSGVQLVYMLATPVTHQLTAQEVQMLLGENYIWSSSGDSMSVTYLADGNATPLESLNLMLGNRYSNPGTVEDVSDREALEILLGR